MHFPIAHTTIETPIVSSITLAKTGINDKVALLSFLAGFVVSDPSGLSVEVSLSPFCLLVRVLGLGLCCCRSRFVDTIGQFRFASLLVVFAPLIPMFVLVLMLVWMTFALLLLYMSVLVGCRSIGVAMGRRWTHTSDVPAIFCPDLFSV